MDSQDYLDQISREARPKTPGKKGVMGVLTSKYVKWGAIAFLILIVIMIFGSMLGGRESLQSKCTSLKLRLDQTNEVITEYQQYLKSSSLRSLSASLTGIFTNTSTQLGNFMTSAYGEEDATRNEAKLEEAKLNAESLGQELFNAKINGLLDRTFAHKMALEIYGVMGEEMDMYNSASSEQAELKTLLESSHTSLNNLYTQFNDFSETK